MEPLEQPKTSAVLFDLGGTLVSYYTRAEFPAILAKCIGEVRDCLFRSHLLRLDPEAVAERVAGENHEDPTLCVRPLTERLIRIFDIDEAIAPDSLINQMCRRFMQPIFDTARVYEDAIPILRDIRAEGIKAALVSNSPWGSPAELWRLEIQRLGMAQFFDVQVYCGDVGWRKPARPMFQCAMESLQVQPDACLFVGDDPVWDVQGARSAGIVPVLLDRNGKHPGRLDSIAGLKGLWAKLRLVLG